MKLYAKTTIEVDTPAIEYNVNGLASVVRMEKPKYRATIEVEWEGEIPEKIMQIVRTGVFE